MIIFLTATSIIFYIVMAGITHGYGKHHWPERRRAFEAEDQNLPPRFFATVFWPILLDIYLFFNWLSFRKG